MSDLDGADYPATVLRRAVEDLMIGADERYLLTDNGTMFSDGGTIQVSVTRAVVP